MPVRLLISSGGYSKQAGDEYDLSLHVPFVHPFDLPFSDQVHRFVSLQRSPRGVEGEETQPRFDQSFDKAVILLDQVVEIFDLPEFTLGWKGARFLQLSQSFWVGWVFVHRNHAGRDGVRRPERFGEKALGGLGIAGRTEEKLQGVSVRIDRALQIHPGSFHLDLRFVDAPGVGRGLQMRSAASVQFGSQALNPAVDGAVIDSQPPFSHQLFKLARTRADSGGTTSRTTR